MERYRNFVRIEEMRNLLAEGNATKALEIAEKIDIRKLKKSSELNLVYEVFMTNAEYERAKACVERLYSKAHTRRILLQLVQVSLKLRDAEASERYFAEFSELAPDDFYIHVFRYNIDKMLGKPVTELIPILEALKEQEYIDGWAYELAKLYHKAGMREKCIKECDNILVWFAGTTIADRAAALRAYYMGEIALENDEESEETEEILPDTDSDSVEDADTVEDSDTEETADTAEDPDAEEITDTVDEAVEEMTVDEVDEEMTVDEVDEAIADTTEESAPEEITDASNDEGAYESGEVLSNEDTEINLAASIEEILAEETAAVEAASIIDEGAEAIAAVEESKPSIDDEADVESYLAGLLEEENRLADSRDFGKRDSETVDLSSMFNAQPMPEKESLLYNVFSSNDCTPSDFFGGFIYIDGLKNQIYRCLEVLINAHYNSRSLVISGFEQCSKAAITRGTIKLLYLADILNEQKVARTSGSKLNHIKLEDKLVQIARCGLLVEHAGEIDKKTADSLIHFKDIYGPDAIVIIDDTKAEINRIFRDYMDLGSAFTNRIHIPKFSSKELCTLALYELYSNNFNIEHGASEELKAMIEANASKAEGRELQSTYDMISAILDNAETRLAKKLLEGAMDGNMPGSSGRLITKADIAQL